MYQKKAALINQFLTLWKQLKEETIITNQKDFTSQIGEWLIAELFNGNLAENGKQKDWDLIANNLNYQVKSHAKSTSSKRRDTDFKYTENSDLDVFVIVVFNEVFELQNIFKIPKPELFQKKLVTQRKSGTNVISWSKVSGYDILNSYQWNEKQKELLSIFGTIHTNNYIENKNSFQLKIIKTYLTSGYININKEASKMLGNHGSLLKLECNKTEIQIPINRTSIGPHSVRLYKGQDLVDLITNNFQLNDEASFEIINPQYIKLISNKI